MPRSHDGREKTGPLGVEVRPPTFRVPCRQVAPVVVARTSAGVQADLSAEGFEITSKDAWTLTATKGLKNTAVTTLCHERDVSGERFGRKACVRFKESTPVCYDVGTGFHLDPTILARSPAMYSGVLDNVTPAVLSPEFLAGVREIFAASQRLEEPDSLLVYDCDGYTIEKSRPDVVVFPTSTEQVARVVRLCRDHNVPFVARGAGTSLAGGCLPIGGGVMISLVKMKRILEVNLRDRYAVVEPGLVNVHLTQHLKGTGYHYAPDPSSQGRVPSGGTSPRTPVDRTL